MPSLFKKKTTKKPKVTVKAVSTKEKVLAEYNKGKNYAQLAEDHGLTVPEVEEIIGAIAHEYTPEVELQTKETKKAKK